MRRGVEGTVVTDSTAFSAGTLLVATPFPCAQGARPSVRPSVPAPGRGTDRAAAARLPPAGHWFGPEGRGQRTGHNMGSAHAHSQPPCPAPSGT